MLHEKPDHLSKMFLPFDPTAKLLSACSSRFSPFNLLPLSEKRVSSYVAILRPSQRFFSQVKTFSLFSCVEQVDLLSRGQGVFHNDTTR